MEKLGVIQGQWSGSFGGHHRFGYTSERDADLPPPLSPPGCPQVLFVDTLANLAGTGAWGML